MNSESPLFDDFGCFTDYGKWVVEEFKTLIKLARDKPDFTDGKQLTDFVGTHHVLKLPLYDREKFCAVAIPNAVLFDFMIGLLEVTPNKNYESFMLYKAVQMFDTNALDVMIRRGWNISSLNKNAHCSINVCLFSKDEKSLDMLDKLLRLGILPRQGFDVHIDALTKAMQRAEKPNPNPREFEELMTQINYNIPKALDLLLRYSEPFPDVKVALPTTNQ